MRSALHCRSGLSQQTMLARNSRILLKNTTLPGKDRYRSNKIDQLRHKERRSHQAILNMVRNHMRTLPHPCNMQERIRNTGR